jgi:hypothetical protein
VGFEPCREHAWTLRGPCPDHPGPQTTGEGVRNVTTLGKAAGHRFYFGPLFCFRGEVGGIFDARVLAKWKSITVKPAVKHLTPSRISRKRWTERRRRKRSNPYSLPGQVLASQVILFSVFRHFVVSSGEEDPRKERSMEPTIKCGKQLAKQADIGESRFDDVNLANSTFHNVNMASAKFEDINLADATFENINFSNVKLSNANYEGMTIDGYLVEELLAAHKATQE